MIRKWLPLLVGLILLGCENDDDQRSNEFLRFSIQDEFIQQGEDYWIMISDAEGNVLDSKELQNASTYAFAFPANLPAATVTMTLIHNITYANLTSTTNIKSYTSVPPGEYHFPEYSNDGEGYNNRAYLTAPGFNKDNDPLDWLFPGRLNIADATGPQPGLEIEASYLAEKAGLLALTKTRPFQYQYLLLDPGQHYTLTSDDFTFCTPRTTALPGGDLSQLNVTGVNAYGEYLYYAIRNNIDRAETTWEIPTMPDIFDSYRIQLTKIDSEGLYKTDLIYTELPTELQILEASVVDFTVDGNVIDWSTTSTHSLDDVTISTSTSIDDNDNVGWSLKGGSGEQHIVLPRIPDNVPLRGVIDRANFKTFEMLADEYGLTATIRDLVHDNGYWDSVIRQDLQATEWIIPESLTKTQQLLPE
jgi:hypothetical protein